MTLFFQPKNVTCLEFSRSNGFCIEKEKPCFHEQINGITAFVDASNVYGSHEDTTNLLRENDGSGKLKLDSNFLLPILSEERRAGDVRAREMPGLAAMHTLFAREHNRICDMLKSTHPGKPDEDYFQNARRILIAEMQKIVYA